MKIQRVFLRPVVLAMLCVVLGMLGSLAGAEDFFVIKDVRSKASPVKDEENRSVSPVGYDMLHRVEARDGNFQHVLLVKSHDGYEVKAYRRHEVTKGKTTHRIVDDSGWWLELEQLSPIRFRTVVESTASAVVHRKLAAHGNEPYRLSISWKGGGDPVSVETTVQEAWEEDFGVDSLRRAMTYTDLQRQMPASLKSTLRDLMSLEREVSSSELTAMSLLMKALSPLFLNEPQPHEELQKLWEHEVLAVVYSDHGEAPLSYEAGRFLADFALADEASYRLMLEGELPGV